MPHNHRQVNALWLTPNVLGEAFTRFLKINGFAPSGKRHGSNAPGPLEARRRHARRRMGLAAHAAGRAGPAAIDVGALFGLGAKVPQYPEKSLRWEPPTTFQNAPLRYDMPPPPPLVKQWPLLRVPQTRRHKAELVVDPVQEAVDRSNKAFNALLTTLDAPEEVDEDAMKHITAFLHSSEDEPRARNLITLITWLGERTVSDEALRLHAACLRDKATLGTLDTEQVVAPTYFLLRRSRNVMGMETTLAAVLDALPLPISHTSVCQLSHQLRNTLMLAEPETRAESIADIQSWFRVLDSRKTLCGPRLAHPTWKAAYEVFARHTRPAELSAHFRLLEQEEFAKILLQHWVPTWIRDHPSEAASMDRKGFTYLDLRKATAVDVETIGEFLTDFEILRAEREIRGSPLVDMLAILAKHEVRSAKAMFEIVEYLKHDSNEAISEFVLRLLRRTKIGMPTSLAGHLVRYFAATGEKEDLRRAWLIFKEVPSLSLTRCPDLPMQLVEHGFGTPDRIFHILNRKIGPEIAVPESRAEHTLALQPAHVDIVQLVAHIWANHEHAGSRVAFRRVWECYRFLQDRRAPLSALMSRSLVRAGILRPLQEGKRVPFAQTRFIISLVKRLEGEEIAGNLDRLVFDINKRVRDPKNLALVARRSMWAGRLDSGIANAVKWRLKCWAKRRRRWDFAAGSHKQQLVLTPQAELQCTDMEELARLQDVTTDTVELVNLRQPLDQHMQMKDEAKFHQQHQPAADLAVVDFAECGEPLPKNAIVERTHWAGLFDHANLNICPSIDYASPGEPGMQPPAPISAEFLNVSFSARQIETPSPTQQTQSQDRNAYGSALHRQQDHLVQSAPAKKAVSEQKTPLDPALKGGSLTLVAGTAAAGASDLEDVVQAEVAEPVTIRKYVSGAELDKPEHNSSDGEKPLAGPTKAHFAQSCMPQIFTADTDANPFETIAQAYAAEDSMVASHHKAAASTAAAQRERALDYIRRAKARAARSKALRRDLVQREQGYLNAKHPHAWTNFGLQWHRRRKRLGYDPHEKTFGERW